ncbi:MAG: outer membrane beta-barrel protein [Pseudomonadota bacterium]
MPAPANKRAGRISALCGGACLTALLPASAAAFEYAITADYQAEYTSNARRADDDGSSDVIHRPGVTATANHAGRTTQLDLRYRLHRRVYQDDSFDSDGITEGFARLSWDAVPGRVRFFASNQRREGTIRTEDEAVPDNLQVSSTTSAGAELTAQSISNHLATVSYTYSDVRARKTNSDSERSTVQGSYVVPLSPSNTLRLTGTGTDVDFDNPLAPDYQSATGTVAYERAAARTTSSVSVGYTTMDRELSRDTVDGYVGNVRITREIGGQSSIAVAYSRDFRDNSLDTWDGRPVFEDDVIVGDTDTNEVYRQQSVTLTYTTAFGANQFNASVAATEQSYETDLPRGDSDRFGLNAGVSRELRPDLGGYFDIGYNRYEYSEGSRDDDAYTATVGLEWDATRRLDLGSRVRYYRRDVQQGAAEREEWGVFLSVNYFLFGNTPRR